MKHGNSEVIIYQTVDGLAKVDVRLEGKTFWLTQTQMTELFQRDQSVISRHIKSAIAEGELDAKSNMQFLHIANSDKPVAFYNLDVIISVGYRVKSQRGTQFRKWANRILKDYIIKGYAINNKLQLEQYEDLKKTVKLLSNVLQSKELTADEATGLLHVITDYTYAFDTLDRYTCLLRKRPRCCFIWLRKIIRLVTETNVLLLSSFYGFCSKTIFSISPTAAA